MAVGFCSLTECGPGHLLGKVDPAEPSEVLHQARAWPHAGPFTWDKCPSAPARTFLRRLTVQACPVDVGTECVRNVLAPYGSCCESKWLRVLEGTLRVAEARRGRQRPAGAGRDKASVAVTAAVLAALGYRALDTLDPTVTLLHSGYY